jgi:hypothetical protein
LGSEALKLPFVILTTPPGRLFRNVPPSVSTPLGG